MPRQFSLAVVSIILFNLVPIVGVMYFNWSPFEMFWLFWMETLVIAIFNTIRVMFSQGRMKEDFESGTIELQWGQSFKYLLARVLVFLFYSLFIVVFIGFYSRDTNNSLQVVKTLGFQNTLFNLALLLSVLSQLYFLTRYFFANKAYYYSKPGDYAKIFDGRQVVIHVAVVLGAVGAGFLFEGTDYQGYAAVWIICVFSLAKCIFELLMARKVPYTSEV